MSLYLHLFITLSHSSYVHNLQLTHWDNNSNNCTLYQYSMEESKYCMHLQNTDISDYMLATLEFGTSYVVKMKVPSNHKA